MRLALQCWKATLSNMYVGISAFYHCLLFIIGIMTKFASSNHVDLYWTFASHPHSHFIKITIHLNLTYIGFICLDLMLSSVVKVLHREADCFRICKIWFALLLLLPPLASCRRILRYIPVRLYFLPVSASDTNPNVLSLAQTSEFGGRSGETFASGGGSIRSQSWMNTLSNASSASKRSSGGPASTIPEYSVQNM